MVMDVFAGCNVKWVEWFKFHWVQEFILARGLYGLLYAWIPMLYNLIGWGGIGYRFWIMKLIVWCSELARRKTQLNSNKELILFGCCFNFRIFQLFRIAFIVIDFSLGIVYAVLSVHDADTEHRLPITDFYNVGAFELSIRNGLFITDRLSLVRSPFQGMTKVWTHIQWFTKAFSFLWQW